VFGGFVKIDSRTIEVPSGYVANVATYMEIPKPRSFSADAAPDGCNLERVASDQVQRYRLVFGAVGQEFLWFSRLAMSDNDLTRLLRERGIEAYVATEHGEDVGLIELDFRGANACELSIFGLVQTARRRGLGRWLLSEALSHAWNRPIARLWLHTCTFDDPYAVTFYRNAGFVPFKSEVEIHEDPRLLGVLPEVCAPAIPLLK